MVSLEHTSHRARSEQHNMKFTALWLVMFMVEKMYQLHDGHETMQSHAGTAHTDNSLWIYSIWLQHHWQPEPLTPATPPAGLAYCKLHTVLSSCSNQSNQLAHFVLSYRCNLQQKKNFHWLTLLSETVTFSFRVRLTILTAAVSIETGMPELSSTSVSFSSHTVTITTPLNPLVPSVPKTMTPSKSW